MHTEYHGRIPTAGGLGLVLRISLLLGTFALEPLLGALIELALEGWLLVVCVAASRDAE